MNLNTYCSLAFSGFDSRTSSVCCWVELDKKVNSFVEIQQSTELHELRQSLLSGIRHPKCNTCWHREDHNIPSMRQQFLLNKNEDEMIAEMTHKKLKYLVLDSGNVCNLACRTCGPYASSGLIKEFKARYANSYTPIKKTNIDILLNEDYSDLIHIEILGGEPFQNLDHLEVLKKIIADGNSKNVVIGYVTNATTKLSPQIYDLFSNFKLVNLTLSIDATHMQFEYIRTNGVWNDVVSNVNEWRSKFDNVSLSGHPTISALNVLYLDELYAWYQTYNMHIAIGMVGGYPEYSFSLFTDSQKSLIIDKLSSSPFDLSNIIDYVRSSNYDSSLLGKFYESTNFTKSFKGLAIEDYLPRLTDLLKN